ncbi:triose-phosphate isomerase [Chitinophagaceae bacterium IBVUCB1]|nr:triose-phosphate isomerase [Chitinophagaceae bacterium IBVUCB1]
MRKKIVAGNWKMNLNLDEGHALVAGILKGLPELNADKQVVIAPPFINIQHTVYQVEDVNHVHVAAQNCSTENAGAYTGEVSASMIQHAGAAYVIIGHSERREYYNETDALLAKKTDTALDNGLKVIFCCGEPLEVRDAGTQNEYVEAQLKAGLFHLHKHQLANVVVAYEPIWAIGTGRTASSQQAQDMHAHIRSVFAAQYGQANADNLTILYGGSCKPSNATELFACADVDGGLIGGASLKAEEFLGIIDAMMNA